MTPIKTYSSRVEADLARLALRAEGIAATVSGVDLSMQGGTEGLRLMVPDDEVDAALKVLGSS